MMHHISIATNIGDTWPLEHPWHHHGMEPSFQFSNQSFPNPYQNKQKNGLDAYMNMKRKQKKEKINGDERKKGKKWGLTFALVFH